MSSTRPRERRVGRVERPGRREPCRRRVQPIAPGHDHGHDQPPDRDAGRHRVPVTGQPLVAAHDQHRRVGPAPLQPGRAPGLDVQVSLAGPPVRQRRLQGQGRVGGQVPQVVLLGRGQGQPQLDQVIGHVAAEGRMPVGGQLRRRDARQGLCRGHERVRVEPRHRDQVGEAVPVRSVLRADPVRLHLGRDQAEAARAWPPPRPGPPPPSGPPAPRSRPWPRPPRPGR